MVLADISGFTVFMEKNEIEHSANILNDLIRLLIDGLSPVLEIAEVEGDAVFAYAPAAHITRGELLLELIEAVYVTYRDRRRTMQHNASCACRACRSISSLDLKFVVHYGDYVLQTLIGKAKPVGASVNLAHRLLKNKVHATTGWRGYALFSDPCLKAMEISPPGIRETRESYENMDTVGTGSIDLDARYRHLVKDRRIRVPQKDADLSFSHDFSVLPPVVWDWMTDPEKRNTWLEGARLSVTQKPGGRMGPSARYHCAASDTIEEILDWRPFDYYTFRMSKGHFHAIITCAFHHLDSGTRVRWIMKYDGGLPAWIGRPLTRWVARKKLRLEENFDRLDHRMAGADLPQAA